MKLCYIFLKSEELAIWNDTHYKRRATGRTLTFSSCFSDFLIPSEESCAVIMILDWALET